jgi:hypothetical protein
MPAPFAAREARVNQAVVGHLANAMAIVKGNSVPVVFDRLYSEALDGDAAAYSPVVLGMDADLAGVVYGETISVHSQAYTVVEIEPDGTGLTRLRLRK